MRDLGEPIGWGPSDATTSDEKEEFIRLLSLPIYNDLTDYQFIDVTLALCKRAIIQEEINKHLGSNPLADANEIRRNIEKEL